MKLVWFRATPQSAFTQAMLRFDHRCRCASACIGASTITLTGSVSPHFAARVHAEAFNHSTVDALERLREIDAVTQIEISANNVATQYGSKLDKNGRLRATTAAFIQYRQVSGVPQLYDHVVLLECQSCH